MSAIDVTIPIHTEMLHWGRRPSYEMVEEMADGYPSDVSRWVIGAHTGTHVDAPSHFVPGGTGVDGIDLSVLVGPAARLDLAAPAGSREGVVAALPDALPPAVVLHTGWSDRLAVDPVGYFGRHAHPTTALAARLVEAGVRLIGIDAPSVDGEADAVHRLLLGRGVVIVENLVGTAALPERFDLTVLPLRLRALDGSPARAIAAFDEAA